ncbi:MAG TPA: TauD/TfdA family dioxygenase, partial [Thermoanaerobaculia bacterium]|nr:TauD/TfdA family dioxygenase [Thermoanaerobaculia bacterium]
PLWRVHLWRLEPSHHLLLLAAHHIVSDGWSKTIVLRELAMLYRGIEPDPLPIQYADYAAWQRERFDGRAAADDLAFWREHYGGEWPVLRLDASARRGGVISRRGARLPVEIPAAAAIRKAAAARALTPFTLLMSAFQLVLGERAGAVVPIATGLANRSRVEIENLIGFFTNTLLFRFDLSDDPELATLLRRTHDVMLGGFARQDLPFEHVLAAFGANRDRAYAAIQAVVSFQNARLPDLTFDGLRLVPFEIDPGTSRFELELSLVDYGGHIAGSLDYDLDVLAPEEARDLAAALAIVCEAVANENGGTRASELMSRVRAARRKDMNAQSQKPRFTRVARRPVVLSAGELADFGTLGGGPLPVVVTPRDVSLQAAEWVRGSLPRIESELARAGALLFRGFAIGDADEFAAFTAAFGRTMLPYLERSTPRSVVSGHIYTSTEYPAGHDIPLHNEASYSHTHPAVVWFFCDKPAATGGETPIADSREVLRRLPAHVREELGRRGVMYVRNYGAEGALDLSWPDAFQTSSRAEVEMYCRAAGIAWEWREGGRLRTRQVRPAIARHPRTGEEVWFNQCHLFHVSSLGEDAALLRASTAEEDLPRNAYFGDGAPLETDTLDAIRRAYDDATVAFRWQRGDVMLVDNFLVAHGRKRFTGERRVLVAMA